MSGGRGLQEVDTKNKTLRCPRDHQVMEEVNKNGALIDLCHKCGGMFFDQGEMFGAAGMKADPSYWDRTETGGTMKQSTLHCSRCEGHMLAQDVAKGELHVEIDRCAHCGGIWLDEGEINKLIEISEQMVEHVERDKAEAKKQLNRVSDEDAVKAMKPDPIVDFAMLFSPVLGFAALMIRKPKPL
jgi:Zn-finger nucleic acid-binding protein